MAETLACPITGPALLRVRQASWRGPLAGGGAVVSLAGARFSVVNASAAPCVVESLSLDPLQRAAGTSVAAPLSLITATALPAILAPGERLDLALAGGVPAQAGSYATTARIRLDGGVSLAVPIAVDVPAAAAWGVACMLLGLVMLGAVNVLAGEGTVKTRLHDALQARQDIHEALDANPAPQSRAGDIEAMDHDFDLAIAVLGERRPASVVDHRDAEASAHLAQAQGRAQTLRTALGNQKHGAAEIADLQREWDDLQTTLKQVPAIASLVAAGPAADFANRVDGFLRRYQTRFLHDPVAWLTEEVTTQLGRMELAAAAGEGDAAREVAINARRWLRRSARALDANLARYRATLVQAGWLLNTARTMRDRAAHDDMADEARQRIAALLDGAAAQMDGAPWLPEWAEAHRLVNAAWTEQVRGVAETLQRRVTEAIAAANVQTDNGDVDALVAELGAQSDHSLAAKQAGLLRVLALWRAHVEQVDDAPTQGRLRRQIDALTGIVEQGKLADLGMPYHALIDAWVAWNGVVVQRAIDRLDHPHCLESYADLQRNRAVIEASLREGPPGPQTEDWDRRLDQIRVDMQREGPDEAAVKHDCMGPLLALGARTNDLSGEIFAAGLADVDVPAATRARLAQASGVEAAIAMTAAVDTVRTLDLDAVTAKEDRVVGRVLTFAVGRLDPVWGSSTTVTVDFGDQSPVFVASAEALRQRPAITHSFAAPLTVKMTVRAEEPGAAAGTLLGEGETTILIAPSPLTAAQTLADAFINLRFALALLAALTVYYWRYHNRTAVFGARGYDYVEAFALGFAADVAVDNLPGALSAFVAKPG